MHNAAKVSTSECYKRCAKAASYMALVISSLGSENGSPTEALAADFSSLLMHLVIVFGFAEESRRQDG